MPSIIGGINFADLDQGIEDALKGASSPSGSNVYATLSALPSPSFTMVQAQFSNVVATTVMSVPMPSGETPQVAFIHAIESEDGDNRGVSTGMAFGIGSEFCTHIGINSSATSASIASNSVVVGGSYDYSYFLFRMSPLSVNVNQRGIVTKWDTTAVEITANAGNTSDFGPGTGIDRIQITVLAV